jgi:uncharacterized membrane protein
VSADGSAVVGDSFGWGEQVAFRWTKDGGMKRLATPFASTAKAISADGRIVVGALYGDDDSNTAVSWADDAVPQRLEQLPDRPHATALGVSGDGSMIVGTAWARLPNGEVTPGEAFIWQPQLGMRELHQVLSESGLDLTGWRLEAARDISADGLTIVGTGTGPRGVQEAWVVVLPEPQSLWIVAGMFAFALRRRRASPRLHPEATASRR